MTDKVIEHRAETRPDGGRSLRWRTIHQGAVLYNPSGVQVAHPTRVIAGTVKFITRARDLTLVAGQSVNLPVGDPYKVEVVTAPAEVLCEYPVGGHEEVRRLLTDDWVERYHPGPEVDDTLDRLYNPARTRSVPGR